MIKAAVLIDGSDFYFKSKVLGIKNLERLNFSHLSKTICGSSCTIYENIFYIGAVKAHSDQKSKLLHAKQQRLFKNLKRHNYQYSLGFLLKNKGGFHEKGVDVKIAIDMLSLAYEKKVKRIYLVSSDTYLIPAIQKIKILGVETIYVGFENNLSVAIRKNCSKTIILRKLDDTRFELVTSTV